MRVEKIASQEASNLVLNYHYAHRMPQPIFVYGLIDDDNELVGCVMYGRPATPQVAKSICPTSMGSVYELNRLVIITDKKNAASFLIGASLRALPPKLVIVSYADSAFGHVGYVYQASNFYYAGQAKSHDSEYIWNGKRYHPRVLSHMGINNPVEWSKKVGAEKLPTLPKNRYVYVTGSPMQKKEMMKVIKWNLSKEYPKEMIND